MKPKQLLVASSLVGICAARSAGAWFSEDAASNACHKNLAFPFATDCTRSGGGYAIQRSNLQGGWDVDPTGGRGIALSFGRSELWTISAGGQIYKRTGTWENGAWVSQPRNACGTGVNIGFDTTGTLQNLAVHAPGPSFVDVPWVIDSSNKVRFWRTSSSPNCWAVVEPVPGDGTLKSIASYVVAGQTGIWAVRDQSSYFFDGQHWQLIDNNTGVLMSRGSYGTDATGTWLGTYDRSADLWTADPTWNTSFGGGILKFISGSSFGPAYIDVHGKVWRK